MSMIYYVGPCTTIADEDFHKGQLMWEPVEEFEMRGLNFSKEKPKDVCDGFMCFGTKEGDLMSCFSASFDPKDSYLLTPSIDKIPAFTNRAPKERVDALGLGHLPSASGIKKSKFDFSKYKHRVAPDVSGAITDVGFGAVGDKKNADKPDVVKHVKTRNKPGKQFFVTIGLEQTYDLVRQDFIDYISNFNKVVTFCVSVEKSEVSNSVDYHMHIYLSFEMCMLLVELREIIVSLYQSNYLDVQSCRSKKSTLKYITKEDRNPFFNCKLSETHINYQMYIWALHNPVFEFTHPFVQQHRNNYKFLQSFHSEMQFKKVSKFLGFKKVEIVNDCWAMIVGEWWNKNIGFRALKQKQLYIYGQSNCGKTTLVEKLIGRNNMKFVFYPGTGHFFMQGLQVDFHQIIVFEEFEISHYFSSYLKRLLEGRPFAYPVKGCADKIFAWRKPIIFISNFDNINDEALRARLLFVNADEKYWQKEKVCLPKEEDSSSEEEVCEVSSSCSENETEESYET